MEILSGTLADRIAAYPGIADVLLSKKYTDRQKAEWICGVFNAVPVAKVRKAIGRDWVKKVGAWNAVKVGRFVVVDRAAFEDAGGRKWSKAQMKKVIRPQPAPRPSYENYERRRAEEKALIAEVIRGLSQPTP